MELINQQSFVIRRFVCLLDQEILFQPDGPFKEMEDPDIISWSVIISGLGEHGFPNEALKLFKDMEEHGITANEVTFLSVLSACSHGKLVDEGFREMFKT